MPQYKEVNYSQIKFNMPTELIYTQEERNSKLQIQNFKVYQELRKKMESSIQRQRKALKHSIQHYVAADEREAIMKKAAMKINLTRNLTERGLRKLQQRGKQSKKPRSVMQQEQMS